MSIRRKFLITFLAISVIPVIFIGALDFYNARKSLEEATLKNLRGVAIAKKTAVMEYLLGKKGRAVDFASDGFIRDQAQLVAEAVNNTERLRASALLNTHLKLNKKPLDEEIVEIRVLDINGKIIGTSEGDFLLGIDTGKNQPYFLEGLKKTYIQDAGIFAHYDVEEEVVSVGSPLKGRSSNKTIGILVNFYSLANIRDVLLGMKAHRWGEPEGIDEEKTSRHIFLTNQQGLLLTPSHKIPEYSPLKYKVNTKPVLKAVKYSQAITSSWLDLQGNRVLGASELLEIEKGWKWILVIEQGEKDVLGPVYELRKFSIIIGLLTILLVVIAAAFIAKSISVPICRITEVADKISRGESDARIDINSEGEIGVLAISFNRMMERRLEAEDRLKVANRMIGEEKTKYEMVLASIGDGMVAVNREGKIMLLNHTAEKMFGWEAADITGRSFAEVAPCEDEKGNLIPFNERTMHLALANNATMHATSYYFRHDNTKFPVAVTAAPIIVEGKAIGAIGIFRDITKEKEVDRMKTDFISTVSHEIRTPLTTIREGVSQALDGILGETTPKQKEVFSIVLEDSDRLKRIIDNLLDISKIEAGMVDLKKEFVDMVALAKGVAASFSLQAEEKGLKINTSFSHPRIMAFADKDRIIQVLTNLAGNALKFTSSGRIDISVSEKEKTVECAVSDTGKGIANEDLPRVFSKFQQFGRTAGPGEKGTGLGLSISKGIIDLHKGKIWIDAQVDKGTRVSFFLPKYSAIELFKECITHSLKKLSNKEPVLSILAFNLNGLGALEERLSQDEISSVTKELEMLVKSKLRRDTDMVVEHNRIILMLLPGMKKEGALIILQRIQDNFDDYLAKKEWGSRVEIGCEAIHYPEDGLNSEELTAKIPWLNDEKEDIDYGQKDSGS